MPAVVPFKATSSVDPEVSVTSPSAVRMPGSLAPSPGLIVLSLVVADRPDRPGSTQVGGRVDLLIPVGDRARRLGAIDLERTGDDVRGACERAGAGDGHRGRRKFGVNNETARAAQGRGGVKRIGIIFDLEAGPGFDGEGSAGAGASASENNLALLHVDTSSVIVERDVVEVGRRTSR